MAQHAFILGGTGQIGRAVASEFLGSGWSITICHRGGHSAPADLVERGAKIATLDRSDADQLSRALGAGTDVLVDATAYDHDHAQQLIAVQDRVGSFVVVSSASVYRDEAGRTLDEAMQNGFPELPNTITESNLTVDPGPATYSTRKVALERHLLDGASAPVTILRPCAIHGLHSRHPREWWLVKRILDRRPAILLAYRGKSLFHTSAVANIAALARVVAECPGRRILNIADPDFPDVAEIAALVARHLNYQGCIVEMQDMTYPPVLGRTPWSIPLPFTVDCGAALDLGYSPVTTYANAVGAMCDWLEEDATRGEWKDRYPVLASYPRDLFDYAAEDRFLATAR